ncbi:MAG: TetR/AcrR family transcriptional regulator [Sterolibacterium sp.]|jgi:AcrR family transcriptional regulator|nr:TetR/AcrR family transcriptional regulator [Sterolibacterium sp.]
MLAAKTASPGKSHQTPARSAAPRGTLSQALILRAALNLIDRDGLAGLTVRKLAEQLGVSAMAIYRHYKNKAEIESELVDLVVGDYDVTSHDEADWREWIYTTYVNMRSALCAHPGVMPLLDNASYQGGKALAVMDRILLELQRAGLSAEQAAQLFHMLMAHMIGSVVLMNEADRRRIAFGAAVADADTDATSRPLSFERVSLDAFPNIATLAPQLVMTACEQGFRNSLMQIIRAVTK